jgi:glycosyltransferase involved in cell wall biosynthesis
MSQESNAVTNAITHSPLNILFVSHDAHPNGAQKLLLTLTSWLKEQGLVDPRFMLAGPGALTEDFLRIGPILKWENRSQKELTHDVSLRLLRSFCGKDISSVYLNSAASGHIIEMTRHLKVPQIVHVHELQKGIERWVGLEKMSALRAHAQLFITASAPVADNLHERHAIPRTKLRVVDAFIRSTSIRDISDADKRRSKSTLGLDPDAKLVLGCGTTDWRKGPDLFIEVAAELRRNDQTRFQFVWVGAETETGQISKLRHLANSNGVGNEVRFVGETSTPLPFMIASDVFLLSSREDPFPLVCLESADCGLPIICFADAGGMPDFVGSTCGKVVPYLDVRAMAQALRSLLGNEEEARTLGDQAKKRVRKLWDVSVKGQEIFQIIRNVSDSSSGSFPEASCV